LSKMCGKFCEKLHNALASSRSVIASAPRATPCGRT
jgi:hypothetical protein